ncbi:MAG TPA: hypothetical protein VL563_15125 [Gemmatimonadales bacterium]|nr:hypothetical protein [Gemmatimonadales bacterium]
MSHWKAGPEAPRVPFCWQCDARLYGRVHARVKTADGAEHDVHKACVDAIEEPFEMVYESSTARETPGGTRP